MEFEPGTPLRKATEQIEVSIQIRDAEPRTRYGSKTLWQPEWIRIVWTRHASALGEWDDWSADARLVGSWLRQDGSRAAKDPTSDLLYRQGNDEFAAYMDRVEKTRPTHEPPALAPIG